MKTTPHSTGIIFIVMICLLAATKLSAQYLSVQLNPPLTTDPEEVAIAINPTNPMNMIAGANLRYVYYSTDGGYSWTQRQLPPGTWGDPAVHFGPDGTAYFAHLRYGWDAIAFRRSSDGGKTWSDLTKLLGPSSDSAMAGPLERSSLQDKEWIIADHTNSQYRGNVYASWTDFNKYGSKLPTDSSVIVFARSTNNGESFETSQRISDLAGNAIDSDNTTEGAVPAVGPNGEVYVCWALSEGLYFDRSFDGGVTFGEDKYIEDQPGGWDIDISGIMRCNGMPVTLADISNSPHRGTVYVNWIDSRNGDPDVFIMKSTDKGDSWSEPIRVNDDPVGNGKEQFFNWATVDPITGELVVVFYDRRAYQTDSTDVFMARSTDGGASFVNERITNAAFVPVPFVFFGDYINVAAYNGIIRPIWTEMHGSDLSIHTAIIGEPVGIEHNQLIPDALTITGLYPNPAQLWSSEEISLEFSTPRTSSVRLIVYDALGREVFKSEGMEYTRGNHILSFDGSTYRAGLYFCKVSMVDPSNAANNMTSKLRQLVLMR
jgi:hypothetical protein